MLTPLSSKQFLLFFRTNKWTTQEKQIHCFTALYRKYIALPFVFDPTEYDLISSTILFTRFNLIEFDYFAKNKHFPPLMISKSMCHRVQRHFQKEKFRERFELRKHSWVSMWPSKVTRARTHTRTHTHTHSSGKHLDC